MTESVPAPAPHIVVMGVSGCGKTTVGARLAEHLQRPFGEADEFHSAANIAKMAAGIPLTTEDRLPWLESLTAWLDEQAASAGPGVISCSALKKSYRDILRRAKMPVFFVHLTVDREQVLERVAQRTDHYMPAALVQSQFDALEPLSDDEVGMTLPGNGPIDQILTDITERLRLF